MPDSIRRALRTFFQAFVGVLALEVGALLIHPELLYDVAWLQRVGIAATAAGLVALVSFAHNALEDAGAVPALGKAPASAGANPVPDPGVRLERH